MRTTKGVTLGTGGFLVELIQFNLLPLAGSAASSNGYVPLPLPASKLLSRERPMESPCHPALFHHQAALSIGTADSRTGRQSCEIGKGTSSGHQMWPGAYSGALCG